MSNYNFFCPTRVLFGQGSLNEFHKQPMPGKKALLVISNGQSTIKNGSLERVKKELAAANCEYVLFNEVAANPLKSTVEKGAPGSSSRKLRFRRCTWWRKCNGCS